MFSRGLIKSLKLSIFNYILIHFIINIENSHKQQKLKFVYLWGLFANTIEELLNLCFLYFCTFFIANYLIFYLVFYKTVINNKSI